MPSSKKKKKLGKDEIDFNTSGDDAFFRDEANETAKVNKLRKWEEYFDSRSEIEAGFKEALMTAE